MMQNTSRWYLHPVFIFACSIISLATALVLTIYWYMEITAALEVIIKKFHIDPGQIFPSRTGMTILVLTLLVTVVLAGILLAFIYYQRTVRLFTLQHNFIYNFTHELKTPVTSLKIYLETFLRHPLEPEDIRKYSKYMLSDVGRLIDNINSILNLARIESRSYGAELTREDLVDLVENFCKSHGSLFHQCRITVHDPGKAYIYPVNILLFEMLLMNILSNAVKYNESKHPRVDISFRPCRQRICIDFSDNGIGIEKSEIKKIFRKFYQAGNVNGVDVKGSGLGLYLVFSIARIHGWKVTATSEGSGKGSVFTLFLPREETGDIHGKNLWKMVKKSVSW
ncbi:Two-component sensor histidine kinase [Desulfamplus magnetovallimortis]|uniref:histidine kinase n=1 Tax=Desulfamplus magnetovallimortis TaxID=1246637 RepID=A0A1W1H4X6_9BACT|nr:HAMP domain-containing sensor histidine kinase [Desulfamplus magnetovallimortis]SLM27533.1 Two-component sensor histidine kinase [Desulfamplus magnetovallimortis]